MKKVKLESNFANVHVFYDCTQVQFGKYLKKEWDIEFEDSENITGFAQKIEDEDGTPYYYVWLLDKNDVVTISHEFNHTVYQIARHVGIKFCEESEEFFTHLQDDFFTQFLKKRE